MKSFFEKTEFSIADIQNLIDNNADEGLYLEFKAADALGSNKKVEISKDVSAFANSDGGLIIYGVAQDENGKATKIDYITDLKFSKDWLQQVLDSNIQRRISNIEIHTIANPENSQEHILVARIKASSQAPHMAGDNLFYRRNNKGNRRMEEYEVRQMYFRVGKTELDIIVENTNAYKMPKGHTYYGSLIFSLSIGLKNIGNSIEHHYKLEVSLPNILSIFHHGIDNVLPQTVVYRHEKDYLFFTYPNESPLFQNEKIFFLIRNIVVSNDKQFEIFKTGELRIKIYSSSEVKEFNYKLIDLLTYEGNKIPNTFADILNS